MELFFEAIADSQKASFEAAASFADSCLVVVERLAQLNMEVARTALEQSSEMALFCLEDSAMKGHSSVWNASLQSGIDQFSAYCQSFRAMT